MIHVLLLLIFVFILYVETALGQTPLGLYVSAEELNIWRQRAINGPYKTKGDKSHNSPGDWTRILNNANSFVANPAAERWSGQTSATCRTNSSSQPNRTKGEKLRDAAFVYLVKGTGTYRDAVRHELLTQATTTGTQFRDSTRWCVSASIGGEGLVDVAPWVMKLLFAYDWIRSTLSASDRATLDTWFLAAGKHFEPIVHEGLRKRWPNRKSNNYGSSPMKYAGTPAYNIYYGGPVQDNWHLGWNNINAALVRTFGVIGIQQNDAMLKTEAKRWFKEWLKYNVWYTNTQSKATHGEYFRCCWETINHHPNLGWQYTSSTVAAMTALANAFHRVGDSELFTYSTSEGYYGTHGGPKSLSAVITTHFQMMDHTLVRYGTNKSHHVGDPQYIQDNNSELTGSQSIGDVWIGPVANRFYKSSYFKSIYMRSAPGILKYPSVPSSSGPVAWSGDQGLFPGVLFMFGEMEAVTGASPLPMAAPSNLSIQLK